MQVIPCAAVLARREEMRLSEQEIEALKKELRDRYEKYAKRNGYRLNPDEARVEETLHGLAMRKLKFGKAYCPCRVMKGIPEEDKKLICPCVFHKEEIGKNGICMCELLVSEDYKKE